MSQVEGAERVHKEELRLQMDIAIGKAPALTDDQLQHRLREEAHEIRDVSLHPHLFVVLH